MNRLTRKSGHRDEATAVPERTVLVAGGKRVGNEGLRAALLDNPGIRLVAIAGYGQEAYEVAAREHPANIVIGSDGVDNATVELARALRVSSPGSRIVVFSDGGDESATLRLWSTPIRGHIYWKDTTPESVRATLTLTTVGVRVMSEDVAQTLTDAALRAGVGHMAPVHLTDLERQVLELVVTGSSEKEAAAALGRSEPAIHKVMAILKRKLGAGSLPHLGARARDLGVVGPVGPRESGVENLPSVVQESNPDMQESP